MKQILLPALISAFMLAPAAAQRLVPPSDIPNTQPSYVLPVQSSESHRIIQLEETIRRLNGKVEELNFLLLQLQEKFRKMEEDNESRFQEIEDKQSSLTDKTKDVAAANIDKDKDVAAADIGKTKNLAKLEAGGDVSLGKLETSGEAKATPGEKLTSITKDEAAQKSVETDRKISTLEPRALGTLTFDKNGNVIDGSGDRGKKIVINPFKGGTTGSVEASIFGATPNEVFDVAKKALKARQYPRAQQAFAAHLKAWPKDPRTGEAQYYLGEALFWQKSYYQAAETYLGAHNEYPEAPTAADNLLGLGLSLAGLNQREVACATYAEVLKQYPDDAKRLGEKVKDEQAAAKC
ncbi:MAG: tol-pal system protein YbgF [Rhizobiaceae bacterium]